MFVYKLKLKFYFLFTYFNSQCKKDPDKINIMFNLSELEIMFYDPLDWIILSSNKYLFNKKFIKAIFS